LIVWLPSFKDREKLAPLGTTADSRKAGTKKFRMANFCSQSTKFLVLKKIGVIGAQVLAQRQEKGDL
jgi:hypothetical protein